MNELYESGQVTLTFSSDENFNMSLSCDESFDAELGQVTTILIHDHTQLINRGVNNQHPISAVTTLVDELNSRPNETISDSFINLLD